MSKVLVTGFGPYGVTPVNPAQLTAEELDGRTIAGATVISRIVPNTFFESIAAAQQAIAEIEPALVIMLGEYPTQHDHRRATRAKRQRLRAVRPRRLRRQGFGR